MLSAYEAAGLIARRGETFSGYRNYSEGRDRPACISSAMRTGSDSRSRKSRSCFRRASNPRRNAGRSREKRKRNLAEMNEEIARLPAAARDAPKKWSRLAAASACRCRRRARRKRSLHGSHDLYEHGMLGLPTGEGVSRATQRSASSKKGNRQDPFVINELASMGFRRGFPVIRVGDKRVLGFSAVKLRRMLGL